MVLKPEPLFEAVESFAGADSSLKARTLSFCSPASGKLFRKTPPAGLVQLDRIVLLCGRYEALTSESPNTRTDELSVGDFVLSGGELAAALVVDAVTRLIPGALGNEDSSINESFSTTETLPVSSFTNHEPRISSHGILDFPHYTRPAEFRGWQVPEILIGGNHEQIRRWRQEQALEKNAAGTGRICYPPLHRKRGSGGAYTSH